jgi:hypothetical protein
MAEKHNQPRFLWSDPPKKKTVKLGLAVGSAGNRSYSGDMDPDEHIDKLQGAKGRGTYDKMRRSDGQITSVLRACTLPIRQANYYIEPASDDSGDVEIAEIATKDFFENMTMTWDDTIRHALLMFPFGFSILEKIWELRDDMIRPRKFDPRLPQSIIGWEYEKKEDEQSRLIGPKQVNFFGNETILPIEKLLVFTTEKEGDNWEGIPLLRPCYKSWSLKDDFEKINAIQKDRWGVGIPVMEVPPNVVEGSPEFEKVQETLQNIYASEIGYVITPEGYSFRIEGGGGKEGTDSLPSIKYYDESIAKAMLAMFISLGTTETGSRALGGDFIELFRLSIQTFADYICEVFSRFALKEYINYNYEVDEYPVMKVRRIQKLDPKVIAELVKVKVISADESLETMVRSELNLPEKLDEEEEPEEEEQKPEEKEVDEETEPEEDDELAAAHLVRGLEFADREFTDEENLCDLAIIEQQLNTSTDTLQTDLMEFRVKQLEAVVLQVVGGRKVQDIRVPHKKEMHSLTIKEYKAQFKQGKGEVLEEMSRQRPDKNFAAGDLPNTQVLFDIIDEELALVIEGMSDKMKNMIATKYLDLKKKGLSSEELKIQVENYAMTKISDAPVKSLAATAVNQGWGAGRQSGMEAHVKDIESVYRSVILDSNACDICAPKDGVSHAVDDPEYVAPDPECEGGPSRCRCINIAIMKGEAIE